MPFSWVLFHATCWWRLGVVLYDQQSAAKSRKDLEQARALIGVLAIQRPDDLKDLWQELCERGAFWRDKATASLAQMPNEIALALGKDNVDTSI